MILALAGMAEAQLEGDLWIGYLRSRFWGFRFPRFAVKGWFPPFGDPHEEAVP